MAKLTRRVRTGYENGANPRTLRLGLKNQCKRGKDEVSKAHRKCFIHVETDPPIPVGKKPKHIKRWRW